MELHVTLNTRNRIEDFKSVMRRFASGVCVVTTIDAQGRPLGMLATAFTSVTATPPTVLICINREASMHSALLDSEVFCVNILGHNNMDIIEKFSDAGARNNRFKSGEWSRTGTGSPVLSSSHAALECKVGSTMSEGSHSVILGKVLSTAIYDHANKSPLVFYDRSYKILQQ